VAPWANEGVIKGGVDLKIKARWGNQRIVFEIGRNPNLDICCQSRSKSPANDDKMLIFFQGHAGKPLQALAEHLKGGRKKKTK
jgi:hypothetical protein